MSLTPDCLDNSLRKGFGISLLGWLGTGKFLFVSGLYHITCEVPFWRMTSQPCFLRVFATSLYLTFSLLSTLLVYYNYSILSNTILKLLILF